MFGQPGEHVGKSRPRVDAVEFAGLDPRIDGGASSAFVRSREGPVVAADRDAMRRALCGIVRHAQAAVFKEADKAAPAVEAVGDGLGSVAVGGQFRPLRLQPHHELATSGRLCSARTR
jgi:hypothetical protein